MQTVVHRIRAEFERPFHEIVEEFAKDGYSKAFTARTLEIDRNYFRILCGRYCPDATWKHGKDLRRECRPCGINGQKQSIKRHKKVGSNTYTDEQLLDDLKKYPNATSNEYAVIGVHSTQTITRRFGSWNNARKLAGLEIKRKGKQK